MPYKEPVKSGSGYILPKKEGGTHKSTHKSKSGKTVHFKSKVAAKKAGRYILALEHGFTPTKKPTRYT